MGNSEIIKLKSPETTYNFEVEDFHTYFVSESNVLVHNMCGTPETATDDFTKLKNGQGWRDKMEMCGKKICYTRIIGMYQIKKA
mgnify:CR=1 FL=1